MWTLIKIEFEKLWKRPKFLVFVLVVFCINFASFVYYQNKDTNIPLKAYRELEQSLEQLPNEERYPFICEYAEQMGEYRWVLQIKEQMDLLHRYPKYLQSIEDRAKTISSISIFQTESNFEHENIVKSAKDYKNCEDIEIVYELEKGIQDALQFPVTYLLLLITMFVIASYMISEEKEKGLYAIVKATPGKSLILVKCLVMVCSIGVLIFLFMLSQLIYMDIFCGLGTLSKSVQSLASYQQFPLKINVLQFLGLVFLVKWAGTACLGLFMLVVAMKCSHKAITMGVTAGVILVEYILFVTVNPLGNFVILKYFNFIFILQAERIFQIYLNINVFDHAVSLYVLMFAFILSCFVILTGTAWISYKKRGETYMLKMPARFGKRKKHLSLSLFGQELYKILWLQKCGLFLALAILLNAWQWADTNIYRTPEQLTLMQYMEIFEGPLNQEKEEFLTDEMNRMSELERQIIKTKEREEKGEITRVQSQNIQQEIQSQLSGQGVFQEIIKQYEAIKDNPKLSFVNSLGYENVFLYMPWTILPAVLTLIILLIGVGNIFTYENRFGMDNMLAITPLGKRKVNQYKCRITWLLAFVFFLSMNVFMLFKVQQTYGLASMTASIRSIEGFRTFPFDMPIVLFLILHFSVQYAAVLCVAVLGGCFSKKFNSYVTGVLFSFVLFVVPLILAYGGWHFLDAVSLYPLLMNGAYMQTWQGLLHVAASLAGYGTLTFFVWREINR